MGASAASLEDPSKYAAQCAYLKTTCSNKIFDQKGETTLETSGEDVKLHSKRVEKM